MAPPILPAYVKDEKVLCFHHELLYEAKVLEYKHEVANDKKSPLLYRVHYKGWKSTWDDWVLQDRLRKFTEENNELRQDLQREANESRARTAPKSAAAKKKTAGSDFSSARGSEERHSSLPVTGRGSKRGRDTEIEKVGEYYFVPTSPGLCPDLDYDYGTDFGGSEVDTLYQSPCYEPDVFIASYDGTGDQPPRRSGRARVPKTIFDADIPAPVSKASKPKKAKKADVPTEDASIAPGKPAIPTKANGSAVSQNLPEGEDHTTASETAITSTENDSTPTVEKTSPPNSAPAEDATSAATNGIEVTEEVAVHPSNSTSVEKSVGLAEIGLTTEDGGADAARSSSSSLTPPPPAEEELPPSPIKPAVKAPNKPAAKGKGKGKGKIAKKANPRKPKALVIQGSQRTVADILADDPPREKYFRLQLKGVPLVNERLDFESTPKPHELRVAEERGRGAPSARQTIYVPDCDRWREEFQRNYFWAGISADMPRRPRNRMGPPRVSPVRARWMRFYKAEKAKGTPIEDIESKFAAMLSSDKKSTASLSSNEQSASTTQASQGSSTIITISDPDHASSDNSSAILEPAASTSNASTSSEATKKRKASAIEDPKSEATKLADPNDPKEHQESTDQAQAQETQDAAPDANPTSSVNSPPVSDNVTSTSNETSNSESSKKRKASAVEDPGSEAVRPTKTNNPEGLQDPTDQAQEPQAPARKKARKARNVKKQLTEPEQEEIFTSRPAVRIPISDHLKALLVDDWENVTKNLSLVPLPSEHPVTEILSNYYEEEKLKRRAGSAEADLLQEIVAGIKEYFNQSLGRILLYRFEREQFSEIRKLWDEGTGGEEWEGKGAADCYGAEHLARLFVSMPELIAQTNMDQQSVNRVREELSKMTAWLGKNSQNYFTADYEVQSQEYIDKARGVFLHG